MSHAIEYRSVRVVFRGRHVSVSCFVRPGDRGVVIYLHGLGSTKRDFLATAVADGLPGYTLVGLDFPGCGLTPYSADRVPIDVPELVELVESVARALNIDRATIIGHSMGGLTGLLLAQRRPDLVQAFINVEGNLAPEDCIWSRQAVEFRRAGRTGSFFDQFEEDLRSGNKAGFDVVADNFRRAVSESVFINYCESILSLSDTLPLLDYFIALPMPRLLIYGSENAFLSYLPTLRTRGVPTHGVSNSNHCPIYTNPEEYHRVIREFLARAA